MDLKQISTIGDMPVLDLETGSVLGRVVNWVVHPKDQRLAALLLDRSFLFQKWPVIVPADIAEYAPRMIVARDKEVVIAAQEVVGLPELINRKLSLTGFRAETDKGKVLGTVSDFVFDTITSRIQKYHIQPNRLTGGLHGGLILPASKVVGIKKRRLVFADDVTASRATIREERAQIVQRA